jgi:hypothetical protein
MFEANLISGIRRIQDQGATPIHPPEPNGSLAGPREGVQPHDVTVKRLGFLRIGYVDRDVIQPFQIQHIQNLHPANLCMNPKTHSGERTSTIPDNGRRTFKFRLSG